MGRESPAFMSDMPVWQSFLSVIGGVGGLCGIYALVQNWEQTKLAREQTRLMREQAKKSEEQEREERQWAERHERLAMRISHIGPNMLIASPNANSHICLYPAVFQDPQFRSKLETYVVDLNASRTEFRPHKATPHELHLQGLRDTVATAEQLIEKYTKENPKIQLMYYLGVEPRI